MVIDFHAHCFPDWLAPAALRKLSASAGALPMMTDGTLDDTKCHMRLHGVDAAVVLGIAVTPSNQKSVNNFAAQICSETIFGFGSVHPLAPDVLDELDRIKGLGIRGIKFHPQYQKFSVDDESVYPVYRKAASLGFITVFHAGHDLGFLDSALASPVALARALNAFSGAPVVAAHLGGAFCWAEAFSSLAGLPIYLDTSFSHGHIPLPEAQRIIEKHGTSRILFGTDLPWSDVSGEIAFVNSLGLCEMETQQILGGNAAALLGI
jgi:uncharacterized protein